MSLSFTVVCIKKVSRYFPIIFSTIIITYRSQARGCKMINLIASVRKTKHSCLQFSLICFWAKCFLNKSLSMKNSEKSYKFMICLGLTEGWKENVFWANFQNCSIVLTIQLSVNQLEVKFAVTCTSNTTSNFIYPALEFR